jgi:hypothetical protein
VIVNLALPNMRTVPVKVSALGRRSPAVSTGYASTVAAPCAPA